MGNWRKLLGLLGLDKISTDKRNQPPQKEASALIISTSEVITQPPNEPPAQANVFVKEINTWIVDKEGKREPVTINIMVW